MPASPRRIAYRVTSNGTAAPARSAVVFSLTSIPLISVGSALVALLALSDSSLAKPAESLRVPILKTAQRPTVDGSLDDPVWRDAPRLTDFVQYEPVDRVRPEQQTFAWLAYDEENLYVAVRAYEPDRSRIRATIYAREKGGDGDDRVVLSLDTFHDKRRAYVFRVTPFGLQSDGVKVEGKGTDDTPDFVWKSAARIDDEGWTVEMAIPFASLRFPREEVLDFGFDIVRTHGRTGAKDSWAPRRRGNPCDICQQGVLEGIRGIAVKRTLDVLPYISASSSGARRFGADSALVGDTFHPTRPPLDFAMARPTGAVGADLRVALTPSVVLNTTVNPDFSQVEADDDQVRTNQRFALFFQERRPFFLEGKDVFEVARRDYGLGGQGPGSLLYTRSVVDPSTGTRVTAKTGAYTLGALYARDEGPAFFYYDGHESSGYVSNLHERGDVLIARARRDVLSDSYVGLSMLGRRMGDAHDAVVGGDLSLRRGTVTLGLEGGMSDERAPFDTVRSSRLDGETRRGHYYRAQIGRSGRSLSYTALAAAVSPEFRNQLGRLSRVGLESYAARVELAQYPSSKVVQRVEQSITVSRTNIFEGGLLDYNINPRIEVAFRRNSGVTASYSFERTTAYGVPLSHQGPWFDFRVGASQRIGFGGSLFIGDRELFDRDDPRVTKGLSGSLRLTLRPVPQTMVELRGQRSNHYESWGGALVDDAKIYRLRATHQFTRAIGVRFIGEYSNQYNSLVGNPLTRTGIRWASSALLTYELAPASFLYVGYNDLQQEYDAPIVDRHQVVRTGNQLFMKLSYLVRI